VESVALEEAIRALLDREEIKSLPNRYCHAVWQGDSQLYTTLFADDGVVTESGLGVDRKIVGRHDLEAFAASASGERKPRPFVHNHVVELVDGTHAAGHAYVEVFDGMDGYVRNVVGWYRDEYVKVNGEWKFQRRDLTFLWARPQFVERMRALH
jgi:hypothetical protein